MSEKGDKFRRLAEIADEEEEITDDMKNASWLSSQMLDDEEAIVKNMAKEFNLSLTDAKKSITFPGSYTIENANIPSMIRKLRKHRRTLKGEHKIQFTKGIDNLIYAYSDHLDSCIKSIYWIAPYEKPLRKMGFNEDELHKLYNMKSGEQRQEIVDILCKYWEAELNKCGCAYNDKYSFHQKTMTNSKKKFRDTIKAFYKRESLSDKLDGEILKSVCDYPGISSRQILDSLPDKLRKRATPQMISKAAPKLNIAVSDEQYYKLPDMFKKDLYSYCAAFIDSDGYITMDKNYSPRVGMVATGNRGKAFLTELQKSLGIGRLVLDEKSPQGTRPVNRLNFYSQGEVTELLTKCRPHLRMKGGQADLLLELIRMKKSYKKADWYKGRCDEIFKLMKWNNHSENPNYDWSKYDVDIENISKYNDNCKVSTMDEIESISKGKYEGKKVDDAIDDLEEVSEEYELSVDDWASVDDASDYLFEHKAPQEA
jgi:hypothetical protein